MPRGYWNTEENLHSAIESMIDNHKNFIIIIDALDECPKENGERSGLCDVLRER
jgi:hypothetical protein